MSHQVKSLRYSFKTQNATANIWEFTNMERLGPLQAERTFEMGKQQIWS